MVHLIHANHLLHHSKPSLAPGQLHLWAFEQDLPSDEALFMHHLSGQEQHKWHRHAASRQHHFSARLATRLLLGHYLQCAPSAVQLTKTKRGKPTIATEPKIHFNTSHTQNMVVIVVSRDGPVGIDVERIDRQVPALDIARRYFHRNELNFLAQLKPALQSQAFLGFWTAKEALLKALGQGVANGLNQFELTGLDEIALQTVHDQDWAEHSWWLRSFVLLERVCGAVAMMDAEPDQPAVWLQGLWQDWLF